MECSRSKSIRNAGARQLIRPIHLSIIHENLCLSKRVCAEKFDFLRNFSALKDGPPLTFSTRFVPFLLLGALSRLTGREGRERERDASDDLCTKSCVLAHRDAECSRLRLVGQSTRIDENRTDRKTAGGGDASGGREG